MRNKNQKYTVLNRNFQFQQVYRKGFSFVSPFVVTYILPRQGDAVRYGITASKKIGCAVERNRARRVIRSAFSSLLPDINGAYDFVFVARKATVAAKSTRLCAVITEQLKKAGIIRRVE